MPTVHLICNAHLDPVWQWRWEEGCSEALSTFRTAAAILREHPALIFNHNEAVLYRWVKEYDARLFREIQELVDAGRWAISGGWYLQPDVNLPGTESLIRQITIGRRFFRENFGVEPKVAYNFDSFGHSAGLPQLLRQAGFEMYIHMRPQAPELELPGDLYRWRGLDGSEIAALRIVVGLYHTERHNIEERLREGVGLALKLNRDVPVFWGIGDHGGGPTREDLGRIDQFIAREQRVSVIHSTPDLLYESLKTAASVAPLVTGDLQRVFTGCYTSLARVKRQAVKSLATVVQTEALRAISWWSAGQDYPAADLEEAWRDHLFNDFHDILPGSCTEPAEQDALALYGQASERCRRLKLGAAAAFNSTPHQPAYIPLTVLHANPGIKKVPVEVECMLDLRPKWSGLWHLRVSDMDGRELPCQEEQPESLLPFNGWRRKVVFMAELPALGAARYKLDIREGNPPELNAPPALPHRLDPALGLITSLRTNSGEESLQGPLLKPIVVEDTGDSWGTGQWSYRKIAGEFKCVPGAVTQLASGAIRTITESVHEFDRSRIVMHTIAYSAFPAIEIRMRIYWQEEKLRLKLALPTTLKAASVTCEVPGGAWDRPADGQEHVHRRWLFMRDRSRPLAVGVVHDGLHGFDVLDGEIRLSVLRSAAYCHEQGFKLGATPARKFMDQGVHEVRLLITAGEPQVVRGQLPAWADWLSGPPATYAHLPLGTGKTTPDGQFGALLAAIPAQIGLLACKQSLDARALIVRLQELSGSKAQIRAGNVVLEFAPYEIKTLRIDPEGELRSASLVSEA